MITRGLYVVAAFLCILRLAEANQKQLPIPDLTKGEKLTRRNPGTIGPVGIQFNIWRPRQGTQEYERVRQFQVKSADKSGPADGILLEGDVVLGANGTGAGEVSLFDRHPDRALPDAIDAAEARDPGTLELLIWRPTDKAKPENGGNRKTVTVTLATLGAYSDTAPYNCQKSKNILRQGLDALVKEKSPGSGGLGILCLLAGDDPTNPNNAKYRAKAKEWAHQFKVSSIDEVKGGAWQVGSRLIALAEYYWKTKDEEILPTLKFHARRYANGQSWFGTTGHRWADSRPDGGFNGAVSGYGALNSSGLHGFFGMVLAREAGVDDPKVNDAIKRADTFFSSYAFKTGIPYGEHEAGMGGSGYDYNGHCGVASLAFALQKNRQKEARWFAKMSASAHGNERVWCHAGPFFARLWNPLGAAVGGEKAANVHFEKIRWHLTIKRNWDGNVVYNRGYNGWTRAATQLMIYALPLRQTYITGRGHNEKLYLSEGEAAAIRTTREFDPKPLSTKEVIAKLSSWAPPERRKAAQDLARRAADAEARKGILTQLHGLASDKNALPLVRASACYGLSMIKDASSAEVLVGGLTDVDYLVRQEAAKALMELPRDAVMPHINTILEVAATTGQPTFPLVEGDPLQFSHGYLGRLLFGSKKGLFKSSIEGVDRKKLWPAARALSKTPAGAFRSTLGSLYKQLSLEEVLEMGDTIVESVRVKAPGDSMFAGGIRKRGVETLVKHSLGPAFPLAMDVGDVKQLSKFDSSALQGETAERVMQWIGQQQTHRGNDMSGVMEALTAPPSGKPLKKMKEIRSVKAESAVLTLPAKQTTLGVDAVNYARRDPKDTTYTWRKIYGAGKVEFAPNASWKSKTTTVNFVGKKPGKYRFEVTMSDTLGFSVVKKTVDVTLLAKKGWLKKEGKLPTNKPPTARSQTVKAVPGVPLAITLSGTDPDGDDLGFVVTKGPEHGKLTGFGAHRKYVARYGVNGKDKFTFNALDGQGVAKEGTVTIEVSSKDVGVAVYESFDYELGPINGREGGTSFGFNGPWKISKPANKEYMITKNSLSYDGFPNSGGKLTRGRFWYICSRRLDADVMSKHKLLENGKVLWLSCFVGFPKKHGFSNFRCWVGLREDVQKTENDIGFQFGGSSLSTARAQRGAGEVRRSGGKDTVRFRRDAPHMIIMRCAWGKTDDDPDTIELYRMFDVPGTGPILLKKPLAVMKEKIAQAKLSSVYCKGVPGSLDEIRIGPTYKSVLLGSKPLTKTSNETKKEE